MDRNCEKYSAIILAGMITTASINADPKHELPGMEPHSEELYLPDTINNNGTSYAASGTGVVHLFTDSEPQKYLYN